MADHPFALSLITQRQYFERGTACFLPEDADFAPQPELLTVAGHIAHSAITVEWFMAGAFTVAGFDMDFAAHEREARSITTLTEARARFASAYTVAIAKFEHSTMAELLVPMPEGPIMGGDPRCAIVYALGDHTAHHRGALAVYARLAGRVPAMPYA